MRRLGAAALVAAAVLAHLAAPGVAVGTLVEQPVLFGFSDGSPLFPYEGSADAERIAALERDAGADVGRLTVRWEEIQPHAPPAVGPPRLDWGAVDELVEAQRAAGVAPLPMLLGAPAWAREPGCSGVCPPDREHLADWSLFVAAAAHRYLDAAALEIWNEPNLRAYWPTPRGPDPTAYAGLFDAAAGAAGRVAPDLPLLTGGLAYVEEQGIIEGNVALDEYLAGFLDAAGSPEQPRGERIGIGLHVYPSPGGGRPDGRVSGALEQARRAIAAADPNAARRRIWVTELGASTTAPDATTGAPITPERQSQLILETLDLLAEQPDVAAALVYTLIDRPPAGDEAIGEEGFGIVTRGPAFSPKPAYCALADRAGMPPPEGC